jgi:hypothetical protein
MAMPPPAPSLDSEAMGEILEEVKRLVAQGDGTKALAVLLHAVRLSHPDGEEGIFSFLDMAKELINTQRQQDHTDEMQQALLVVEELLQSESLIGEAGDGHILRDAFMDGSSIVCRRCQALVKRERWEPHRDRWCPALPQRDGDDDDEEEEDEDEDEEEKKRRR